MVPSLRYPLRSSSFRRNQRRAFPLRLEQLEDRTLLSFTAPVFYNTNEAPFGEAVGDFNHDGFLDLAVANSGFHFVSVFYGNGDGTFEPAVQFDTVKNSGAVTAADLNGDGHLDLVLLSSNN